MSDQTSSPSGFDITPVTIEDEMRRSYLDYAMSVIVSRALPDVRDGLKPVHRRILYAMKENGYDSTKPFKKSARIVGDVMGKYHPHGDGAIYDAMVRMAQDFSMRLMLIDGQGNFGSMDGDPPAAMRYTEARLSKAAESLLDDIDKDTVDFVPNYDETEREPTVLPARFPNLLVNGAGGIAVGMATNIPSHNLREVCDGCIALIDNPDLPVEELLDIVHGPDFPTGGQILGRAGIRSAFLTGRGSILLRAKHLIEPRPKDREAIVFTEIPYQVNKAKMVERISEVSKEGVVEGISEMRDESDRDGVRVVVELKKDANTDVVLNQLYKFTPLQTSFGVNMLALNGGRPELMTLPEILRAFLHYREDVITRRTIFELGKARERAHTLLGLGVAVVNIDPVIELIRNAPDSATARAQLQERAWRAGEIGPLIELVDEPDRPLQPDGTYFLSEAQARAILDLRLHRLTGLEREKIVADLREVVDKIAEYLEILRSRETLMGILRDELVEIRDRFGNDRRTEVIDVEYESDIEDLIQREDMVVTVSHGGYIKRVPLSTYRAQKRGGKGRAGMATRGEDFVSELFIANTHTPVLFFSSRGICYKLKVYRLPVGTPQSRGKALVNLLPLQQGEAITAVLSLTEDEADWDDLNVMFATASGNVRRNKLSDFRQINRNGKIAMKLDEGDSLISVRVCQPEQDVLLSTAAGMCIRFPVADVRVFSGRTSTGVRGIRLGTGDRVISMSILRPLTASAELRAAYLKQATAVRRAEGEETDAEPDLLADDVAGGEIDETQDFEQGSPAEATVLPAETFDQMRAEEEFLLTVSAEGFGKRSSAYAYRRTGRGGKGIWAMEMGERNSAIAANFAVMHNQQIIVVSDRGQLMRCGVDDVRIAARKTLGVTLFRVGEGERVVSVAAIPDDTEDDPGAIAGGDDTGPGETSSDAGWGNASEETGPEGGPEGGDDT